MIHRMVAAAVVMATSASAQIPADNGMYRLYKFKQEIGAEHYRLQHDGSGVTLHSEFRFVDRGAPVPLVTNWQGTAELVPRHFDTRGQVSRLSRINDTIDVVGGSAAIRHDSVATHVVVAAGSFIIDGYAPVAMQNLLLQYWDRHGRPASIPVLPAGSVRITQRGVDTVTVHGRRESLRRYAVDGLIWGRETVWRNAAGELAGLVSIDAEFDHFEAVRDGYQDGLNTMVARAAADGAVALAAMTRSAVSGDAPFALVGGTLVDGSDAPPIADAVVVVRGGRIVAAGPRSSTPVPAGMARVDITGKTILPGLWDMHAHYEQVEWGPIYLASGITTARDVGNELEFITGVRDAIASGRGVGPRLLLAGVIDGPGPMALGVEQAATPDAGAAMVRRYHDLHFNQIKIYSSVTLPVLTAITAEAHRLGMTVTGHIPNGLTGFDGVNAGMDQINHVQYIVPMMRGAAPAGGGARPPFDSGSAAAHAAVDFLKAHHTVIDPTLVIFELSFHSAAVPYSDLEPGVLKVASALQPALLNTGIPAAAAPIGKARFEEMIQAVAALHRAGIPIVAGTDQTVPGYSLHRELELYVEAGFTPLEAIQSASIVPARVMGVDGDVGTVTAGKRADMIVVTGDPLHHIADTRNVVLVISAGRRYQPGPLWRSVGFTP
jgi:imidazolonepropionase-like amidohydrolase